MSKRQKKIKDLIWKVYKGKAENISKMYWVIENASDLKIALCGSVGRAFCYGAYDRLPDDIDFVTNDIGKAFELVKKIFMFIDRYRHYGKLYIQNKTDWCPDSVNTHLKIINSFGLNICIMVLKPEVEYSYYYTSQAVCVQSRKAMIEEAKKMTERDGKKRSYFEDDAGEEDYDEYDDTCEVDNYFHTNKEPIKQSDLLNVKKKNNEIEKHGSEFLEVLNSLSAKKE